MTNNLSRRSILARAVAGTAAAALPGTASYAFGAADPIFPLIESHRAALAALLAADDEVNLLEEAWPEGLSFQDELSFVAGQYKGEPLRAHSEEEFKLAVGLLGVERGLTLENTETKEWDEFRAEYQKLSADFDKEVARCERGKVWRAEHRYDETHEARDAAAVVCDEATDRLLGTVTKTAEGLLAFLEYLSPLMTDECWELPDQWEQAALRSVTASVRQIATE